MSEKLTPEQLEDLPSIDLLRETLRTGERIARIEEIPVERISTEVLIVDEDHSEALRKSISGPRGQISAIVARARIGGKTKGDIGFDIIDGFHRFEAVRALKWPTIQGKVLYGCSDEEMYDLRILAASSVKAVKYPRLKYWMRGAWNQTSWRNKISLLQACNITRSDSSGERLGLSRREAEEIKRWVNEKSRQWLIPVPTLADMFLLMESAAPDLIEKIRPKGKFVEGKLSLTRRQLGIIARAFSGEFELQRQIASFAVGFAVSTKDLQTLVEEIGSLEDRTDKLAVNEILRYGRWQSFLHEYTPKETKITISQLFGPLRAFETLLARYPVSEKVKEDILRYIGRIESRIEQAEDK